MTTNNTFNDVQEAAQRRNTTTMNSETLAKQIVAAAQGDARMAYDFLDILNAHVTRRLQEKKP
jgi:replication-associated recombination protein RarA